MRLQRYLRSLQSHIYFKMETETLSDRENLFKEVPFRLRPMNLRTRSGTNQYEYLNLSGHELSNEETLWLLREADGKNSPRPDQNITKKGLVARYGLYRGFFAKNWRTYKAEGVAKDRGRWRVASRPSQLSSIKAELAAARNDSNEVSFPELVQLISKSENSHKRKIGTLSPKMTTSWYPIERQILLLCMCANSLQKCRPAWRKYYCGKD